MAVLQSTFLSCALSIHLDSFSDNSISGVKKDALSVSNQKTFAIVRRL